MASFAYMGARFSIFSDNIQEKASTIYQNVWNTDPDSFQSMSPFGSVGSNAMGVQAGVSVAVSVQPNRIDYSVGPTQPGGLSGIPSLPQASLYNALLKTIDAYPNLESSRVAMFLSLGYNSMDFQSANSFLSAAIHDKYCPKNLTSEEDFTLSYNLPMSSSSVDGLLLYRIYKFAAERVQTLVFSTNGFAPSMKENIVASLGLDYNNRPTEKLLTKLQGKSLSSELLTKAFEDADSYLSLKPNDRFRELR